MYLNSFCCKHPLEVGPCLVVWKIGLSAHRILFDWKHYNWGLPCLLLADSFDFESFFVLDSHNFQSWDVEVEVAHFSWQGWRVVCKSFAQFDSFLLYEAEGQKEIVERFASWLDVWNCLVVNRLLINIGLERILRLLLGYGRQLFNWFLFFWHGRSTMIIDKSGLNSLYLASKSWTLLRNYCLLWACLTDWRKESTISYLWRSWVSIFELL